MNDLYPYRGWSKDAVIKRCLRDMPPEYNVQGKVIWLADSILAWFDDNDIDLDDWDEYDVMQEARELVANDNH